MEALGEAKELGKYQVLVEVKLEVFIFVAGEAEVVFEHDFSVVALSSVLVEEILLQALEVGVSEGPSALRGLQGGGCRVVVEVGVLELLVGVQILELGTIQEVVTALFEFRKEINVFWRSVHWTPGGLCRSANQAIVKVVKRALGRFLGRVALAGRDGLLFPHL